EDGLPVERAGAGLCHARVGAVVDDDRGALVGPGFQEVDAQAFPAAQMRDVSMPCRRSSARAASPTGLPGSTVTSAASSPKSASETATLASPPPKVASRSGDWNRRSAWGDFSRSMISPRVMTLVIGPPQVRRAPGERWPAPAWTDARSP